MKNYNYIIGAQVVLFDGRNEFFGKVERVTDKTVLCVMGTDSEVIEFDKGKIIPLDEVEDLFETPELIPNNVSEIIATFDEDADPYAEMDRILDALEPLGYVFTYYLDAEPYWLRKI